MERILLLPAEACRKCAVHGLGHWHSYYPDRVLKAIDEFLAREPGLRPELRRYAGQAKRGVGQ
jgi:hypothetical protein